MREKKFRILLNGTFHYWGFVEHHGRLVFVGLPQNNYDSITMEEARDRSQQFTGRYDKSGKEVYEGDKVNINGETVAHVEWCDGAYELISLDGRFINHLWNTTEIHSVIGNIYEVAN